MSDDARLLPPNSTALEKAVVGAADLTRLAPEVIARLWNADTCPQATLPWLAWALSVDEWDATWPEATQRRVIKQSIEIHRHKGTVAAVRAAFSALGHSGNLVEWWQQSPPGPTHTFIADVEIDQRGIDIDNQRAIERQIIAVKPARSHFSMRLIGVSRCAVHLGHALVTGADMTVFPYPATEAAAPTQTLNVGLGLHAWGTLSVYPQQGN